MHRRRLLLAAALTAGLAAPAPAAAALEGMPTPVYGELQTPWDIQPAPDGRIFITERVANRVRVILPSGALRDEPVYRSGGLVFGLELHPDFATNRFVYLYERYADAGTVKTRIVRLKDDGSSLVLDGVVFAGIPSNDFHDGGRMAFGPDGNLYVTTGDLHNRDLPRDRTKLNGKILRFEAPGGAGDGAPAADNPFIADGGNARYVWSLGHRHSQGLAFDAQGRLWSSEHGPSGETHLPEAKRRSHDELNLIERGGDYGWPDVVGYDTTTGRGLQPFTIAPKVISGTTADTTWAPADLTLGQDGILYAPALSGKHLRVFETSGENVTDHYPLFETTYGRLRAAASRNGALLLSDDPPAPNGTTPPSTARILCVPFAGRVTPGNPCPKQPTTTTPTPDAQPDATPGGDGSASTTTTTTDPLPGTPALGPQTSVAQQTPILADRIAPRAAVRAGRSQRALRTGRVTLVASCDEACSLTLSGTVAGRRLVAVRRRAAARTSVRMTVRVPASLRRTLSRGRVATLRLRAADAAGNARTRTVRVRLTR